MSNLTWYETESITESEAVASLSIWTSGSLIFDASSMYDEANRVAKSAKTGAAWNRAASLYRAAAVLFSHTEVKHSALLATRKSLACRNRANDIKKGAQ
jgi:hypothetical protein